MKKVFKTALISSLPVMAGYMVLGFGFGIIAVKNGFGILWALAMSVFVYAGSMQYVAVDLLTSGASFLTMAITTFMVNARHLFYGISMVDKYKGIGKLKWYRIFALTDETYSLVCTGEAPDGVDFKSYTFLLSLINQTYWVTGSLLGAAAGSLVPWNFKGVDFAMTALFITVFVEQWKSTRDHIPALVGLIATLVCLVIFGSDRFLIPAMIAISAGLLILRHLRHGKEGGTDE